MRRRRTRRNDHELIARGKRIIRRDERRDGLPELAEVGHPHQAGRARGDHRNCGGSTYERSCCCALERSISDAAAAEDASQAVFTLPEAIAAPRTVIACSA